MTRLCLLLGIVPLLAACQEKVVHDGSVASQFARLNKDGWSVVRNDQPPPGAPNGDPNVRVIRAADFSGLRFNTNFQVDDPKFRQQTQPPSPAAASQPASPPPGLNPWGAAPITPGH